ncbi:hypothetical protein WJX82_004332 [Trebouxia sp. C0006]
MRASAGNIPRQVRHSFHSCHSRSSAADSRAKQAKATQRDLHNCTPTTNIRLLTWEGVLRSDAVWGLGRLASALAGRPATPSLPATAALVWCQAYAAFHVQDSSCAR